MGQKLKVIEAIKNDANQDSTWFYSDIVKDHFFNPRNFLKDKKDMNKYDGYGKVDNVLCGDRMDFWIKVDRKNDKIVKCSWLTWGCTSAISSTSMLSEIVTKNGGMKIDDALKIRPFDIVKRLGGLPKIKYHCSVLGDQALRAAIYDYFRKSKQENRIKEEVN